MRLFRSGALVFSANITDFVATLARNAILARLLTVQDFGIVATFSILVSLMDMAQSSGLNRMIVQARDADDPALQSSLHSVQLSLAVITAVVMLALAWPYAVAMSTPQLVWAYALLTIVPVIRGLGHLDMLRLQRQGRFGPSAVRQIVPPIAGLLAIWPAFLWLGDYRTVLVTIFVQQLCLLLVTHFGAEWKYRLGYQREHVRRAMAFGWPLMINSLLIFVVLNGDRIVVSNQFGLEALGWFSAAVMITMMPINLVANTLHTLLLPSMSKHQDDLPKLQRQYDLAISLVGFVAVGFVASFALLGGLVLLVFFGLKFTPAEPYLTLLAIMQGIRLLRAAPAIAAMARAETRNPLYTNLIRGAFIPISLLVALLTQNIYWMLLTGVAGEVAAGVIAALLARRMAGLSSRHFHRVLGSASLACGAIAAVKLLGWPWPLIVPSVGLFFYTIRNLPFGARTLLRS